MKDVRALRSTDFPPEEPLAPSICLTAWILHFQLNQVEDGSRALLNADLEAGHAAPCSAFSEFLTDSPGNLSHPRQSASALRENRTSVFRVEELDKVPICSAKFVLQLFQFRNLLCVQRLIRVLGGQLIVVFEMGKQISKQGVYQITNQKTNNTQFLCCFFYVVLQAQKKNTLNSLYCTSCLCVFLSF